MNTEIIIQGNSNIKRAYLRTTRISRIYAAAIAGLLAAILIIALFTMQFSGAIDGFCYPSQKYVRFFYPVSLDELLNIGDDIWVGDTKGQITYFDDDYVSYDTLDDSTDSISVAFMNSEFFDKDEIYRAGIAQFENEIVGDFSYRMVFGNFTLAELAATLLRGR